MRAPVQRPRRFARHAHAGQRPAAIDLRWVRARGRTSPLGVRLRSVPFSAGDFGVAFPDLPLALDESCGGKPSVSEWAESLSEPLRFERTLCLPALSDLPYRVCGCGCTTAVQ